MDYYISYITFSIYDRKRREMRRTLVDKLDWNTLGHLRIYTIRFSKQKLISWSRMHVCEVDLR